MKKIIKYDNQIQSLSILLGLLIAIAVKAFISYSVMAFLGEGITKNIIVQGIALLSVGLLIYGRK